MLKVKESDILKAILIYLKYKGYLCKRNNAGKMFRKSFSKSGKESNYMIKIGEAGWPDIEGITKEGRFFGIEVKAPRGTLSDLQRQVGAKIMDNKGIWFVAYSLDDVIKQGF